MESRTANLKPHTDFLWKREDYDDLVAKGVFSPADKVELLNGRILTRSPQNARHATACALISKWLNDVFARDHHVRIQMPVALDDLSEPEPDLAVVRGGARAFTHHHPAAGDTVLVVEIADTSLEFDRGAKLQSYLRAGIPEYWIVNLVDGTIEVHRSPSPEGYLHTQIWEKADTAAPLGYEQSATPVADLLP